MRSRFGYTWSDTLLARLTPPRRAILQPVPPMMVGESRIPRDLRDTPPLADATTP